MLISVSSGYDLDELPDNSELWRIMLDKQGVIGETTEYLFTNLPCEDALTITEEILSDHIYGADEVRTLWYDSIPDSIFLENLLFCRLADEPLAPWRAYLDPFWSRRLEDITTPEEAGEFISGWIDNCLEVRADRTTLRDPWSVLYSGYGTEDELLILLGASLRSVGIPARRILGYFSESPFVSSWYEVWTEDGWYPLPGESTPSFEHLCLASSGSDKADVTANYTSTGWVELIPVPDVTDGPWNALIKPEGNLFSDEFVITMNPFEKDSLEIGIGEYLVEISFIHAQQPSDTWIDTIVVTSDSTVHVYFMDAIYHITPLP